MQHCATVFIAAGLTQHCKENAQIY